MSQALSTACAFARALDNDDFALAGTYLSADCCYDSGQTVEVGPDAILASYRGNAEWGRSVLDSIAFESVVEPLNATSFLVHYTDRLRKGEHAHGA